MKHQELITQLRDQLSEIVVQTEASGAMGLTDHNKIAEHLVCGLLREGARDSAEIAIAAVQEWNPGKRRRFKPEHLKKAWERLKTLKWDTESRSAMN